MESRHFRITQFGNPILRNVAQQVPTVDVVSSGVQHLIEGMRTLLITKKLGVGLAAPQVGVPLAVAVIEIQNTAVRPNVEPVSLVIINPIITQTFGRRLPLWEGCISCGAGRAGLFAKVPRYKKIELAYTDENGITRQGIFEGFPAHVIQHEVDHLNGVLFVDKVVDTTSYMTYSEYRKMKRKK